MAKVIKSTNYNQHAIIRDIIDLHNGRKDLKKRIIRSIGDPDFKVDCFIQIFVRICHPNEWKGFIHGRIDNVMDYVGRVARYFLPVDFNGNIPIIKT